MQQSLGYLALDGNLLYGLLSECKQLPEAAGTSILAVLVPSKTPGKYDYENNDGELDLHLMALTSDGEVVAQTIFHAMAYDDAYELTGLQIDTAPYRLAPQQRGFAIRIRNSNARCNICNTTVETERLDLFLMEKTNFRWVLRNLPVQANNDERICLDDYPGQSSISTIAVASKTHLGLADLRISTVIKSVPGTDPNTQQRCRAVAPSQRVHRLYQFDGEQYRPLANK